MVNIKVIYCTNITNLIKTILLLWYNFGTIQD